MRQYDWVALLEAVLAFLLFTIALGGCAIADAIHERQAATVACRDLGFFAATKDSGVWYCYRDKLLNGTMP